MALTDEQIAYFRRKLGTPLDEADTEDRFTRLGSEAAVVVEVLEERLSTFARDPASMSIAGKYSQDTRANLESLREALYEAKDELAASGDEDAIPTVRIVRPNPPGTRAYDTEELTLRGRTRGR